MFVLHWQLIWLGQSVRLRTIKKIHNSSAFWKAVIQIAVFRKNLIVTTCRSKNPRIFLVPFLEIKQGLSGLVYFKGQRDYRMTPFGTI